MAASSVGAWQTSEATAPALRLSWDQFVKPPMLSKNHYINKATIKSKQRAAQNHRIPDSVGALRSNAAAKFMQERKTATNTITK
jgi:hypothetical protein